jgi:predicted Zn-dependent protease
MRIAAALAAAAAVLGACAGPTPVLAPVSPLLEGPLSIRANGYEAQRAVGELEAKGDWRSLASLAGRVTARNPADEDWLVILGYACLQGGQYAQAIEALRRAVERAPEDADAANLRGEALRRSGQPLEAARLLERSVMDRPNSPPGWYLLGLAYTDLKRLDRARAAYLESVRIDPDYAMGWFGLAGVLARLGPRKQYEDALKRLGALNPALLEEHRKGLAASGR